MAFDMGYNQIRCPGIRASDKRNRSTKRRIGDLTPASSAQLIEDKPEINNIEISIFLERILSTFNKLLEKLELSVSLPILLAHPLLPQILTEIEMHTIIKTFSGFSIVQFPPQTLSSLKNISEILCSNPADCNNLEISDEKINEALEILNSYGKIREIAKSEKNGVSGQCKLFIRQMKFIMEHAIRRIEKTPEQMREKEVYYREIWHTNEKAHLDINDLSGAINTRNSLNGRNQNNMMSKHGKKYDVIEKIEKKFEADVKNFIVKSERKQLEMYKTSQTNRINMKQNLKEAKDNLESRRMKNILTERNVAAKRYKTEAQLAGVISKYDSEMGEKQKEFNELKAEYDSIHSEKLILEENMEIQLEIYNGFIREREEAILNIFRERLEKFIRLRAAKIIQRWWQKIYWRWRIKTKRGKSVKKKNKKKKKKG